MVVVAFNSAPVIVVGLVILVGLLAWLLAINLGLWLLVAVHEIGHVVAARANGIPILYLRIGSGPGLTTSLCSTKIELRALPLSGMTIGDYEFGDSRSWRRVIAGGPVVSIALGVVLAMGAIGFGSSPGWVRVCLVVFALISLLMGISKYEGKVRMQGSTQMQSSDRRQLQQLKRLDSTLSAVAMAASFGTERPTSKAITALRQELPLLEHPGDVEAIVNRLFLRLSRGFDEGVGAALVDLASVLPPALADITLNAVIYQSAVGCWNDREDDFLQLAKELKLRNPGEVMYGDTYGALLTSIGKGRDGLVWLLDAESTVAELPRWMPGMSDQIGWWHMFVALAMQDSGEPIDSVSGHSAIAHSAIAHAEFAHAEGVRSPLLAQLPGGTP